MTDVPKEPNTKPIKKGRVDNDMILEVTTEDDDKYCTIVVAIVLFNLLLHGDNESHYFSIESRNTVNRSAPSSPSTPSQYVQCVAFSALVY